MRNYSRPLNSNEVVEEFLKTSLQFDYSKDKKFKKIIPSIVDGELGTSKYSTDSQTIDRREMRDSQYRGEEDRWKLRQQIIGELLTKKRLVDDEKILLTKGGALPESGLQCTKKAFILIGLPASGKSSIANQIAEDYGAIVIDSDYAKRKLPEFNNHLYGASIVHEESSQITFGFKNNPNDIKSLYEMCLDDGANMIIPRVGQNPSSIIKLASALKNDNGYEVHLVLVSLPRIMATIRAIYRYAETKRYVPLGLIFDFYGNDPSHCYYYLRCKYQNLFESMGVISTISRPAEYTDALGRSPVLKYQFNNAILQLP
jgi:hypothetical protein